MKNIGLDVIEGIYLPQVSTQSQNRTGEMDRLQTVNFAVFVREVPDVGRSLDPRTSDTFHQILRIELVAKDVDFFAQPSQQRIEFPFADLIIEVSDILVDLLPQL